MNQIWYLVCARSHHVTSPALLHHSVLQHPANGLYILPVVFLQSSDRPEIHRTHTVMIIFNTTSWLQGLHIYIHTMLIVFCPSVNRRYKKISAFISLARDKIWLGVKLLFFFFFHCWHFIVRDGTFVDP